jgi:trehalose 6-phosphate phosphatase
VALPLRAALLLDLDGTLLDFAATPDSVIVPDGLIVDLRAIRARLGDALAIVTGRPIAQVDALLGDAPYAVAGEHGTAFRAAPGAPITHVLLPALPTGWADKAKEAAACHDGALYEPKAHGFVLHYRQAPTEGAALRAAALAILGDNPDFMLMPAAMAWEAKPVAADKGAAARTLMSNLPFAGRTPVYIGDDVTDLDGIAAAQALGGVGWQVAPVFGTPAGVRAWLHDLTRMGSPL